MKHCTPYQNHHHHSTVVTGSQWGRTCWPYRVKLMSNINPIPSSRLKIDGFNFYTNFDYNAPIIGKSGIIIYMSSSLTSSQTPVYN